MIDLKKLNYQKKRSNEITNIISWKIHFENELLLTYVIDGKLFEQQNQTCVKKKEDSRII